MTFDQELYALLQQTAQSYRSKADTQTTLADSGIEVTASIKALREKAAHNTRVAQQCYALIAFMEQSDAGESSEGEDV